MKKIKHKKKQLKKQPEANVKQETVNKSNYLPYILLGVIVCFLIIVKSNFIGIAFERDEGDYCYLGQMILDGKTPYIDLYEQKFPGLFYMYALLLAVFGQTVAGIQTGFIFLSVFTVIFLFLAARKMFDAFTGLITAAAYTILSLAPHVSGFTVQSEHLISFFASASLLLLIYALKSGNLRTYFFSGLLIGIAFLIKPNAVFIGIFIGLAIVIHEALKKPVNLRLMMRYAGIYSAGVFSILGLTLLVIVAQGAYHEMIYWAYEFSSDYVGQISREQGKQLFNSSLNRITTNYELFWYAAPLGLLVGFINPKMSLFQKIFIGLLAIFSFLTIVPGLRFYGHYWIQMLPGVAILIGVAFFTVKTYLGKFTSEKIASVVIFVLFLILIGKHIEGKKSYYFHPDHTQILREVYGVNPFPESMVIGDFIRERTNKNDQIAIFGSEPQIYFYTDCRSPSKHHYMAFLMRDADVFPKNREFQQELINDVENTRPKYMVFFNHPISWLMDPNADKSVLNWFDGFANQHYNLVGLADMLGPSTNYLWYEQINNYQPKGQYFIRIYERKQ